MKKFFWENSKFSLTYSPIWDYGLFSYLYLFNILILREHIDVYYVNFVSQLVGHSFLVSLPDVVYFRLKLSFLPLVAQKAVSAQSAVIYLLFGVFTPLISAAGDWFLAENWSLLILRGAGLKIFFHRKCWNKLEERETRSDDINWQRRRFCYSLFSVLLDHKHLFNALKVVETCTIW